MATTNKTPYEIRLELLQMAKDHLESTFKAQCDFAAQLIAGLVTANKANLAELQALVPKAYTIEEIMAKATELYSFVQKK